MVVPLTPHADWRRCLEFSRSLALAMERNDPKRYTTAFAKAGRESRILVDYLRNNRTNTSVAAFSTRAKEGAAVSMPLEWKDLTASMDPRQFNVMTVEGQLKKRKTDPWADYWKTRQRLSDAAAAAVRSL